METCMAWGCETADGWFDLIYQACQEIKKVLKEDDTFVFDQIKEKFGGLRLYCSTTNDEAYKIADSYEEKSYKVCEYCGSQDDVESKGLWIKTLCKKCRDGK